MKLTNRQRKRARKNAVAAAMFSVRRRANIAYTQGSRRWDGVGKRLRPGKGQYPRYGDCSSMATWWLWCGLRLVKRQPADIINGARWTGGYTGTQINKGRRVRGRRLPGDLIFYGRGSVPSHVAMYIGGGRVVSHGSDPGPMILPVHYRPDYMETRRYI